MITTQYELSPEDQQMLETRFTYHPPLGDQSQRYMDIRDAGRKMAVALLSDCPRCAELTLAVRRIEEAIFYACASIARNEEEKS